MAIFADNFLNLSKFKAHDLAEANSLVYRLVSVDGAIFLGYPTDEPRTDRICVEIENGVVVKATIQ
jgi:hypothetical protein